MKVRSPGPGRDYPKVAARDLLRKGFDRARINQDRVGKPEGAVETEVFVQGRRTEVRVHDADRTGHLGRQDFTGAGADAAGAISFRDPAEHHRPRGLLAW